MKNKIAKSTWYENLKHFFNADSLTKKLQEASGRTDIKVIDATHQDGWADYWGFTIEAPTIQDKARGLLWLEKSMRARLAKLLEKQRRVSPTWGVGGVGCSLSVHPTPDGMMIHRYYIGD